MVVINLGICGNDHGGVVIVAIAHIQATAVAVQQVVGHLVAHDFQHSAVCNFQTSLSYIEASVVVIIDVKFTGSINCKLIVVV